MSESKRAKAKRAYILPLAARPAALEGPQEWGPQWSVTPASQLLLVLTGPRRRSHPSRAMGSDAQCQPYRTRWTQQALRAQRKEGKEKKFLLMPRGSARDSISSLMLRPGSFQGFRTAGRRWLLSSRGHFYLTLLPPLHSSTPPPPPHETLDAIVQLATWSGLQMASQAGVAGPLTGAMPISRSCRIKMGEKKEAGYVQI